jgi:hypothetical protein
LQLSALARLVARYPLPVDAAEATTTPDAPLPIADIKEIARTASTKGAKVPDADGHLMQSAPPK